MSLQVKVELAFHMTCSERIVADFVQPSLNPPLEIDFWIGFKAEDDSEIHPKERPCMLPRIATPLTHRSGLLMKHSSPAFSHFMQGIRD
jgi:hypothetical protein